MLKTSFYAVYRWSAQAGRRWVNKASDTERKEILMRRIISICKEVPLLPIAIIAAIPLALLGSWRPWEAAGVSLTFGPFNPGVGQWIVIALVVYTIVVTADRHD